MDGFACIGEEIDLFYLPRWQSEWWWPLFLTWLCIWLWVPDTLQVHTHINTGRKKKKPDKWHIHLQYVLTFIPSGFCRETNGHRCGHIHQQHRPRVIHWYGELWLYLEHLPHPHTNTFVHCLTLASSDMNAVIPHAVFWRPCGPPQLFVLWRKPRKTGVDAVLFVPCESAWINQVSELKKINQKSYRNDATLCYRVRQQFGSQWRLVLFCSTFLHLVFHQHENYKTKVWLEGEKMGLEKHQGADWWLFHNRGSDQIQ